MTEKQLPVLFQKIFNFVKYFRDIYLQFFWLINGILILIYLLLFWHKMYLYIWNYKKEYFPIFIFCGLQVSFMAVLNSRFNFIKFLFFYLVKVSSFVFIFSVILIYLVFNRCVGSFMQFLIAKVPVDLFLSCLTSKFIAILLLFYSIWMIFFLFFPKKFYANSEKRTVLNSWILPISFYLILFYPAFHYYVTGSKFFL